MVDAKAPAKQGKATTAAKQAKPVTFDIPAGTVADALEAFKKQSGAQVEPFGVDPVVLDMTTVKMVTEGKSAGVSGSHSRRAALDQLLKGTGLTFLQDENGTFYIEPFSKVRVPGGKCSKAQGVLFLGNRICTER
ncbi:MAG: STN domain-containing protein [Sphingomicrobium sp.]